MKTHTCTYKRLVYDFITGQPSTLSEHVRLLIKVPKTYIIEKAASLTSGTGKIRRLKLHPCFVPSKKATQNGSKT
jgi:hypothetical protein